MDQNEMKIAEVSAMRTELRLGEIDPREGELKSG